MDHDELVSRDLHLTGGGTLSPDWRAPPGRNLIILHAGKFEEFTDPVVLDLLADRHALGASESIGDRPSAFSHEEVAVLPAVDRLRACRDSPRARSTGCRPSSGAHVGPMGPAASPRPSTTSWPPFEPHLRRHEYRCSLSTVVESCTLHYCAIAEIED